MADTFFELPNNPEEFGVSLPPANLRRIDFSALEFSDMRRAQVEYIKTYFPNQFNDFVANNGIIMLSELVSYLSAVLSTREDVIADDSFLPTSQTRTAVDQHLELINNKVKRATPAIVDIEISLPVEAPTTVRIPAGLKFNIVGSDGNPLAYELYRAPGDFSSEIIIFPGTRGVVGFGIEGSFADSINVESTGGSNQEIEILDDNILEEPIIVTVITGNTSVEWRRIDTLERAVATDEVFEVVFADDKTLIKFGNDIAGKAPLAGQELTVEYRIGGGIRGRIASNAINETRPISPDAPISAPVEVLFRNLGPSNGGQDEESIEIAKRRAPRESATLGSAIDGSSYAFLAKTFNHPIYGSVLKAVATLRSSLNANLVELYVLAVGPDDIPVTPSKGLKQGLVTYFSDINVFTDEIRVLDGAIKPVDVDATIVISRNSDPSVIRTEVDAAVESFFDQSNFDLGQPLYISNLSKVLQDIDGVRFIKIFSPKDDIIKSDKISGETDDDRIGFNELITLGSAQIKIYFEKA